MHVVRSEHQEIWSTSAQVLRASHRAWREWPPDDAEIEPAIWSRTGSPDTSLNGVRETGPVFEIERRS